jgi:hypothetical protein
MPNNDWMEESTLDFSSYTNNTGSNTNSAASRMNWSNTDEISSDLEAWLSESSEQRDRLVPESENDGFGSDEDSVADPFCEEGEMERSFYDENESQFYLEDWVEEGYLDLHAVPTRENHPTEEELALWGQLENNNNNIGVLG